jgi:hypothetical protein
MEEDLVNFAGRDAAPRLLHEAANFFLAGQASSLFVLAEIRFRIHNVMSEQARFNLIVSSLTKEPRSLLVWSWIVWRALLCTDPSPS